MLMTRFATAEQQSITTTYYLHYFLHSPNFSSARSTFHNKSASIDRLVTEQYKTKSFRLFHGNPTYSFLNNKLILDAKIKYILETKRFDGPIFYVKESSSMYNSQNETTLISSLLSLLLLLLLLLLFVFCLFIVYYGFPGNNMYISGHCNVLLIRTCDF